MFSENVNREVVMGATFYATLTEEDTGEVVGEFEAKNIVLDSAYMYMAKLGAIPWDATTIHLGQSADEPTSGQTELSSFLVMTSATTRKRDSVNPRKWTLEAYFSSDEALGVSGTPSEIREIAAGWGLRLLNRAIFRDSNGQPITITKSSSQVLSVKMEFEVRRA